MTQSVPAPSLPPDLVHLLETYCIGRKLGGGSFGTVGGQSELLSVRTHSPAVGWQLPSPEASQLDAGPTCDECQAVSANVQPLPACLLRSSICWHW